MACRPELRAVPPGESALSVLEDMFCDDGQFHVGVLRCLTQYGETSRRDLAHHCQKADGL
jgi:hypothetical protein